MAKLYFNTRDELTCIESDLVALVKADGNYSKIVYITGKQIQLTSGISRLEIILKSTSNSVNRFVRLGRSHIINHRYLFRIEPLKQSLLLSDGDKHDLRVILPKQTLKAYKDAIHKRAEKQREEL